MRWRLVAYQNKNAYPVSAKADEATPVIVDRGVVSISISRAKSNPEGIATVTLVGKLSPAIFHGNWVIIRSKVGEFTKVPQDGGTGGLADSQSALKRASVNGGTKPNPIFVEGLPRFIGQIDSVESTYHVDPASGLVTRSHTVRIREWSHVFRQTIKYDLFDLSQQVAQTPYASIQTAPAALQRGSINPDPKTSLQAIAKSVTNPFEYVAIALAMVSGISKSAASRVTAANATSEMQKALDAATFYSNIATRMPAIPKALLTDMGLGSKADPDRPFAAEESFALVLLGNQKPGIGGTSLDFTTSRSPSANQTNPPGTFDGIFSSDAEIKNSFKVPQDRPVMFGSLADFSQEFDLWELIAARSDPDVNELFTDIWYHQDLDTVVGRPVLVMRDKPFLLDQIRENIGDLSKQWSSFDDLPKVYIPSEFIQGIATNSTFVSSPNYTRVNVRDPLMRTESNVITTAQVAGRAINSAAQARYGGIFYAVDSPYFAQVGSTQEAYKFNGPDWYTDLSKLMQGWYGVRIYFPSGQITLKDNNIPIMVGCNIVFNVGKDVTCVAHVDSVAFTHQVSPRGDRLSTTTVGFSYLAGYENGKAFVLGSETVQDLFVPSKAEIPKLYSNLLGVFGKKLSGTETAKTAGKAIAELRKLEKQFLG